MFWRQGDARIKTKQNEAINYFLKVSEGEKETSSHDNIYFFLCKGCFKKVKMTVKEGVKVRGSKKYHFLFSAHTG